MPDPYERLPLALLMPRIRTNDPHNTPTTDNPAILTYTFYGTSNFHLPYLLPPPSWAPKHGWDALRRGDD